MELAELSENILFKGIEPHQIEPLLSALQCTRLKLKKGQNLIERDDEVDQIYILLSGSAHAVRTDYTGRDFIYTYLQENSIFGDMLAAGQGQKSLVTITMLEASEVLCIPFENLLSPPSGSEESHILLLQNLISMYSEKYFSLLKRVECLSAATLREKIMHYLSDEAKNKGGSTIQIPFDRSSLASYLGADRSALCRELSRMKRDGIIDYYKNSFKILKTDF